MKVTRSEGVVTRSPAFRKGTRTRRCKEYFYGPHGNLMPHSQTVRFHELKVYRIGGGPRAPTSALPIGTPLSSLSNAEVASRVTMLAGCDWGKGYGFNMLAVVSQRGSNELKRQPAEIRYPSSMLQWTEHPAACQGIRLMWVKRHGLSRLPMPQCFSPSVHSPNFGCADSCHGGCRCHVGCRPTEAGRGAAEP